MIAVDIVEDARLLLDGSNGALLTPRDDPPPLTRTEERRLEIVAEMRGLQQRPWDVILMQSVNLQMRYDSYGWWDRERWRHTTGPEREALLREGRDAKQRTRERLGDEEYRRRNREIMRALRENMSDEQRAAANARQKERRAAMSPAQKERHAAKQRERKARQASKDRENELRRAKYAALSPEELEQRRRKQREAYRRRVASRGGHASE